MLILTLSDTHGEFDKFNPKHLPKADAVLFAGDLTDQGLRGDQKIISAASEWLRYVRDICGPVYWIPGNHDWDIVLETFDSEGITCINGIHVTIGGLTIAGIAHTPFLGPEWAYCTTNSEDEEEAVWSKLWREGAFPDIIVSHGPPKDICDLDYGQRLGSSACRRYLERFQPALFVCGHIHEDAGIGSLGRTVIVNTSCVWRQIEITDNGAVNVVT